MRAGTSFARCVSGLATVMVGGRWDNGDPTATVQYNVWKGLFARVEYRHDQANEKVFETKLFGPTSKAQDTLSLSLYYSFF